MKKAVKIIAIIASIGLIVNFIILCVGLSHKEITWGIFLTSLLSNIIIVILVWALHYALNRIEILAQKVNLTQRDVDLHNRGYSQENPEDMDTCKVCGYQLFPEDEKCPNCNTPREQSNKQQ